MTQKNTRTNRTPILICLFSGLFFYCSALVCFAQVTATTPKENSAQEYVSIDFDNVDIRVFIKFISKLTRKNFIIDNRVKGNVTVISPTRITIKEAYQVFESVLAIHGYSPVSSGTVIKIVPFPNANKDNMDTRLISGPETATDQIVTRIIPLEYATSDELKRLLAPLVKKGSVLLSYRDTNMLIVTSTLSSIERLLKIIHTIDVPNIGKKISVIPVKNADAGNLVKNLSSIFTARIKRIKGRPNSEELVQFVADERTNSIILLASKVETDRVVKLIALLDQQIPKGEERIRVYYLEHASAEELVKVLQDIPTEETQGKTKGKKETPLLSDKVHISADTATNSLIIMADKEDYPVLEEVIAKLDIPRAMVYIECLIMEVNISLGLDIGTEWKTAQAFGGDQGIGFGGFGATGDSGYSNSDGVAKGNLPKGFSMGVIGKAFNIGGVSFTDIQAVVEAYQNDNDVHILATPQILTMENEEASITVGKNVPYQTRSAAETGTTTYSSYEYRDVGISLKITPQISEGKLVRLNVFQELTKLDANSNNTLSDRPTTFKRQIQTTIIVEDGNSVVIGGLIDETTTTAEYKTPCLGDVPLLGWAFKRVSEGGEKTNLYVFLTPRVIMSPLEAEALYKTKKQDIDQTMNRGEVPLYKKIDGMSEKVFGKPAEKKQPLESNPKPNAE
jgi:general secretion pathway protein D